jgi:hypothetical protein
MGILQQALPNSQVSDSSIQLFSTVFRFLLLAQAHLACRLGLRLWAARRAVLKGQRTGLGRISACSTAAPAGSQANINPHFQVQELLMR